MRIFALLAIWPLWLSSWISYLPAQSKAIDVVGNSLHRGDVDNWSKAESGYPSFSDSRSVQQLAWERTLGNSASWIGTSSQTVAELFLALEEHDLPIVLDASATDADLQTDSDIVLPFPQLSLYSRLEIALGPNNCSLQFVNGVFRIVSMDIQSDPAYFQTITYDVSAFPVADLDLIETIQSNLQPDEWADTGQGDQTISVLRVGGRRLMVVGAPYSSHRELREFLSGITRVVQFVQAGVPSFNRDDLTVRPQFQGASTAVTIPDSNVRRGIAKPKSGTPGSFGGGGIF